MRISVDSSLADTRNTKYNKCANMQTSKDRKCEKTWSTVLQIHSLWFADNTYPAKNFHHYHPLNITALL